MLDAGPPVDAAVRNALFRSRADHPCAVPTRRRALKSARTFPHQRGTYAARSKRGDLRLSNRTKYAYASEFPHGRIDPMGLADCSFTLSKGRLTCRPHNPDNSPVNMPAASGNNGDGMQCRNNAKCTPIKNHGPIPIGQWRWTNGVSSKPGGRVLEPVPGTGTNETEQRTDIQSHSCANPFGPGLGPQYCSEGCVTGTATDISNLNALIDAEPGSTLTVEP